MLIKLTLPSKDELWIESSTIWMIHRDPKNPLLSAIGTVMMGPQGPLYYAVLESPHEIAELVRCSTPAPSNAKGSLVLTN